MAFIGAVTKKDLTSLGSILLAGLMGIIICIGSKYVYWFISSRLRCNNIGVVVFMGLTAYDVNRIVKELVTVKFRTF